MTRPKVDPIKSLWHAMELCRGIPFDWMVEWASDGRLDRAWRVSREPYHMVALLVGVEAPRVRDVVAALASARAADFAARGLVGPVARAVAEGNWALAAALDIDGELMGANPVELLEKSFSLVALYVTRPTWWLSDAIYELTSDPIGMSKTEIARVLRGAFKAPTMAAVLAAHDRLCEKS